MASTETIKLFISYRSLDSAKVDTLVSRLQSLKNDDGSPRYKVWQDKFGIPPGADWWSAIVNAIIDCDVFVFMVSHESVHNPNCRAELNYAHKRNRPIIPLVIEGEFNFNPITGKNDIDYWANVPEDLTEGRLQFLFYEGVSFVQQIENALTYLDLASPRWADIPGDRPPDPRPATDTNSDSTALYDQACDYAFRAEFDAAEKIFRRLMNAIDFTFNDESREWVTILIEYAQLLRWNERESTRFKAKKNWPDYVRHFPLPFVEFFDPKSLHNSFGVIDKQKEISREDDLSDALKDKERELDSSDQRKWQAAINSLQTWSDPKAEIVLGVAATKHNNKDVQMACAFALCARTKNTDPRAIPGLRLNVESGGWFHEGSTAQALGDLAIAGHEDALEVLEFALSNKPQKNVSLREQAATQLGRVKKDRALRTLLTALKEEKTDAVLNAIIGGLGKYGSPEALEPLKNLLDKIRDDNGSDRLRRDMLLLALPCLGEDGISVVIKYAQPLNTYDTVIPVIRRGLGQVPDQSIPMLKAKLQQLTDFSQRQTIQSILEAMPKPK